MIDNKKWIKFDLNSEIAPTENFEVWFCKEFFAIDQWINLDQVKIIEGARWIDYRIHWLLKTFNKNIWISYSRYADDLCFSFNRKINFHKFVEIIIDIIIS